MADFPKTLFVKAEDDGGIFIADSDVSQLFGPADSEPAPVARYVLEAVGVAASRVDVTFDTPAAGAKAAPVKRGKKKEEEAPPPPAEGVTAAEVQAILEQVFEKKGMPAARDILFRYGAQRVRELKPESYADFVSAAQRVLDGEMV